jgi:hypothetical protein
MKSQMRTVTASAWGSCLSVMFCLLVALACPSPTEGQITNGVFVPGSTNYGKTYPQWLAAWHQWADSLETIHHPLFVTADLSAGQSGPVWFLGRNWVSGPTNRTGVVPAGTALFVALVESFADSTGCPTNYLSETQLRNLARATIDQIHDVTFTIDGVAIQGLLPAYRFQTPTYSFVTPPNNNILEALEGEPCYSDHSATPTPWTVSLAVADGICVMVAPLALGPHTIHFTFQYGFPTTANANKTFNLTVVDANLGNPAVLPPDSAPYGKTYAQWAAENWKWLYSLPIDRHPLFDTADLSAGQSGDVWFLGAAYTNGVKGGTAVRNSTVPDGKALFVPLIDQESATAEGNGTNYGQLFSHSQFLLDHATNLAFVIDGQPVTNLEHYRAQSPLFTWGPLPTNNVFGDPVKFPVGLTSQSVADGYYVMLAPLPAGTHTLHFTGAIKTSVANGDPSNFESELDITYDLTVTPASLSFTHQGSSLLISWPQTGTSYVLEQTDRLNPANWSSTGVTAQPVAGTYQVTAPTSGASQFFRLRKQ